MCCEERHRHRHGCECGESEGTCDCEGGCDCDCDCEGGCGHNKFHRRYHTKAEQIAALEKYLAELKTEVQAVEERLTDLHT